MYVDRETMSSIDIIELLGHVAEEAGKFCRFVFPAVSQKRGQGLVDYLTIYVISLQSKFSLIPLFMCQDFETAQIFRLFTKLAYFVC